MTDVLSSKNLVMIVGPSAVGKSTLMQQIVDLDHDFAYVRSFTTRSRRPNESSYYDFIDRQTADKLKNTNQVITHFEHPTTHHIYGTTVDSYPGKYNLLDTLSSSVEGYRSLGFKKSVTICLTAPAEQWRKWFLERYPDPTPEAMKRLDEAILSINWALNDNRTYWLENHEGQVVETAQRAIEIVKGGGNNHIDSLHPRDMLELIKGGLWPKK